MITMEFDEMKKIWDSQNNEPIYGINETGLHKVIRSKKKQTDHITNASELLWIGVNIATGSSVLAMNLFKDSGSIFMYLLSGWMLVSALYLLVSRVRRIRQQNRFDRSMHGDLSHAISVATYQERLSTFGRWNILPIAVLSALGVWESGKSVWVVVGILAFFVLTHFAAGWEHNIYRGRKRELEKLKNKLESAE
jgi:hypothetical protein